MSLEEATKNYEFSRAKRLNRSARAESKQELVSGKFGSNEATFNWPEMRHKWQSINSLGKNNNSCQQEKGNFNRLKKSYATMRKSFRLQITSNNNNNSYEINKSNDNNEDYYEQNNNNKQFAFTNVAAKFFRSVYAKSRRVNHISSNNNDYDNNELDSIQSQTVGSFKTLSSANGGLDFINDNSKIKLKSNAELKIELRLQRSRGKVLPSASYRAPNCEKACDGLNLEELEEIKRDNLRQTLIRSTSLIDQNKGNNNNEQQQQQQKECICVDDNRTQDQRIIITERDREQEEDDDDNNNNNNDNLYCSCASISISSSFSSIHQLNNVIACQEFKEKIDNKEQNFRLRNNKSEGGEEEEEEEEEETTRIESRALGGGAGGDSNVSVVDLSSLCVKQKKQSSFKQAGLEIQSELERMFDSLNELNFVGKNYDNLGNVCGKTTTLDFTRNVDCLSQKQKVTGGLESKIIDRSSSSQEQSNSFGTDDNNNNNNKYEEEKEVKEDHYYDGREKLQAARNNGSSCNLLGGVNLAELNTSEQQQASENCKENNNNNKDLNVTANTKFLCCNLTDSSTCNHGQLEQEQQLRKELSCCRDFLSQTRKNIFNNSNIKDANFSLVNSKVANYYNNQQKLAKEEQYIKRSSTLQKRPTSELVISLNEKKEFNSKSFQIEFDDSIAASITTGEGCSKNEKNSIKNEIQNQKIIINNKNKNFSLIEEKMSSIEPNSSWQRFKEGEQMIALPLPLPPELISSNNQSITNNLTDEHLYATIYGCSSTSLDRNQQQQQLSSKFMPIEKNMFNNQQEQDNIYHFNSDYSIWRDKFQQPDEDYYNNFIDDHHRQLQKNENFLHNNQNNLFNNNNNIKNNINKKGSSSSTMKLNKPKKSFFSKIKNLINSTATNCNLNESNLQLTKLKSTNQLNGGNQLIKNEFVLFNQRDFDERKNLNWKKSATLTSKSTQNLIFSNNKSLSRKSINSLTYNDNNIDNQNQNQKSKSFLINGFLTLGRLRGKEATTTTNSKIDKQIGNNRNQLQEMFDRNNRKIEKNRISIKSNNNLNKSSFNSSVDSLPSADSGLSFSNILKHSSSSENENNYPTGGPTTTRTMGNLYSIGPNDNNKHRDLDGTNSMEFAASNSIDNYYEHDNYIVVGKARAKVDCNPCAYDKEALVFKKGDIIDILERDESGTWIGRIGNQIGHFKFINVTEIIYDDNRKFSISSSSSPSSTSNENTNSFYSSNYNDDNNNDNNNCDSRTKQINNGIYITKLEIKSKNQDYEDQTEQPQSFNKKLSLSMNTINTSNKIEIENNQKQIEESVLISGCKNNIKEQSKVVGCTSLINTTSNGSESPSNETIMSSLEQLLFAIGLASEQVSGSDNNNKDRKYHDHRHYYSTINNNDNSNSDKQQQQEKEKSFSVSAAGEANFSLTPSTLDSSTSTSISTSNSTSYLDVLCKGGIKNLDSFSAINNWKELEQIGIVDDEHQRRLLMAARIIRQASQAAKLNFVEIATTNKNTTASLVESNLSTTTTTTFTNNNNNNFKQVEQITKVDSNSKGKTMKSNNSNEPIYVNLATNCKSRNKSASVVSNGTTTGHSSVKQQQQQQLSSFPSLPNDSIVFGKKQILKEGVHDQDEQEQKLNNKNEKKRFQSIELSSSSSIENEEGEAHLNVLHNSRLAATSHAVGYVDRPNANSINQSDHYHFQSSLVYNNETQGRINNLPLNVHSRADATSFYDDDDDIGCNHNQEYDVQEEIFDLYSNQQQGQMLNRGYSVRYNTNTNNNNSMGVVGTNWLMASDQNRVKSNQLYNDLDNSKSRINNYHNQRSSFAAFNYSNNTNDSNGNYYHKQKLPGTSKVIDCNKNNNQFVWCDNNDVVVGKNINHNRNLAGIENRTRIPRRVNNNGIPRYFNKTNTVNSRSQINNSKSAYDLRLDLSHFFS